MEEEKHYAIIGSRTAPQDILDVLSDLAEIMANKGFTLRSGGADGCDRAGEIGCDRVSGVKEIFRPKHATPESIKLAMEIHPAPHNCNDYVRKLHGRNCQIILGQRLDKPVKEVYCWTPGGKTIGGTGMGIKVSELNNIPVKNLYDPDTLQEVKDMIQEFKNG